MGHDDPQSLGARESGGGLALPVWIDYMAQALKGQPVAPRPEPPDGLAWRDDDWVYAEYAEGGGITGIGLDEPVVPDPAQAASSAVAEPAASQPAVRSAAPAGPAPTALPVPVQVPVRASGPQAPVPVNGP
jgi:penicillin-binding protein 1A